MARKTDILEVLSRKLAPFMFLFGLYLLSYGHLSPGGGFQGGVVIASGVILLALSREVDLVESLFPVRVLSATEGIAFILLLAAGTVGLALGLGFLGNFLGLDAALVLGDGRAASGAPFIFILNVLIGVKVAGGTSIICIHLFKESSEWPGI
jgi:multicomponent Na+:H+ antiporter subunit B